jgi:hypothetical protein
MMEKSAEFDWRNYLPQHRPLIALRFEQAKRLKACSICGKTPIAIRTSLVHQALKTVGAEGLDARQYVKALALCAACSELDNDQLGDWAWPGWR